MSHCQIRDNLRVVLRDLDELCLYIKSLERSEASVAFWARRCIEETLAKLE